MSKLLPTPKDVLTSNTGELSKRMENIIDTLHTYDGTVGVYFDFPLTYAIQKELNKCGWQVYKIIDQSGFWVQPKRFPIKFAGFCLNHSIVMCIPAIGFMITSLAPDVPRVIFIVLAVISVVALAITRWVEDINDF